MPAWATLSVAREHGAARLRRAALPLPPRGGWLRFGACCASGPAPGSPTTASRPSGEGAPIRSLSGGNVQRAVLARELAGDIRCADAANPVFGLDFAAVAEIHGRIRRPRARRRRAADQRRPGRAAVAGRPHRGDERGPHRVRRTGRRPCAERHGRQPSRATHMGGRGGEP
jgi:hypothetical protein